MKRRIVVILSVLLIITLSVSIAYSQAVYNLTRSTVSSGGGISTGGGYVVQGGIGHPVASPPLTGGMYSLTGGFWTGTEQIFKLMLPLVSKN